jgi:hypothetical protein
MAPRLQFIIQNIFLKNIYIQKKQDYCRNSGGLVVQVIIMIIVVGCVFLFFLLQLSGVIWSAGIPR